MSRLLLKAGAACFCYATVDPHGRTGGFQLLRNNQKTPFNEQGLFWQRTIILIEIVQGCSAILKRYF